MNKIIIYLVISMAVILFSCEIKKTKIKSSPDITEIDDYITKVMTVDEIPGLALAVIKDGNIIHKKHYGYANIEHKVPVSDSTIFRVYSTTKLVTAVGIFQLIEQGHLSLEDSISKYILELPESWKSIKVKHLLSHSSGLPEYKRIDNNEILSNQEIWSKLINQDLVFQKGDHFEYNQTGYWFLLKIIEKITGKTFGDFIINNQFSDKNTATFFASNSLMAFPNRVAKYNYNRTSKKYEASVFAAGKKLLAGNGLNISLNELIKWNERLDKNTLLKKETKNKMWAPFTYKNEKRVHFLHGWDSYQMNDHTYYGFSGGGVANFMKFDTGLTIIILSNGFKYTPRMSRITRYVAGIADTNLNEVERNFYEKFRIDFLNRDIDEALKMYRNTKEENSNKHFENSLNNIGYDFLSVENFTDAIQVFELNVKENPTSANAYDSLGEAYFLNDQIELSKESYKKSFELDPKNINAKNMLKKMTNTTS